MKHLQFLLYFTLILAFTIIIGISGSSYKMTGLDKTVKEFDYLKYWKQIDSLERLGLPGSAISIVEQVYENANSEKNEEQIVKALIFKMKFEHTFQPDYFTKRILELEKEVGKYEYSIQSILHSMLGEMYWQYFRNNRYLYYYRSQTTKYDSEDIETWDLDKILGKAREHYLVSVAEPKRLKSVNLEDNFNAILLVGERDAVRRPSLFDLLAFRAIDFFKSSESSINKPISSFSLNKKEYFAPDIEFIKLAIETTDTTDHRYQTLRLYQVLIASNLKGPPGEALLDADINRLDFLKNQSSHALKKKYYLQTLENMLQSYSGNENLEAEIKYYLAKAIAERANDDASECADDCKDDYIKAISLCNEVLSKKELPDFVTENCRALIQQINQKTLQTKVEKVILPQEYFPVSISYRNLDSIYVRIYKTFYSEVIGFMRERNSRHGYFGYSKFFIDTLITKVPLVQQAIDLPDAEDYRQHRTEIILPPLPAGQYAILVSTNSNFMYDTNAVSLDFLTSSSLSYIRRGSSEKQQEYYVFDRKSGKPMNNVQARFRTYEHHYGRKKDIIKSYANLRSNEEGYFSLTLKYSQSLLMELIYEGDTLRNTEILSPNNAPYFNYNRKQPDHTYKRIHIFTDRAIYRPGQTIYFKGIFYKTDQKKKHEIQGNYTAQVRLLDVNHQEIEKLELTTNEYGTFSGSFTLPQGLLNGRMQISTPYGSKFIQVEEYKRPKFEVSFEDTKGSPKLEEEVKATGSAMTFSGAPLENADVKYRVVRKTIFPYWYWWIDPTPDQEIANGTSTTAKNGEFEIIFTAVPDYGESKQSNPVFNYTITADVTDINGETHSASKTIKIGYAALMAGTNIPEILDKKENSKFRITTTNIEGNYEGARGTITIHKLTGPKATYKSRSWEAPDKFLYTEEEFHRLLPDYPYAGEQSISNWPKEKISLEQQFDTEQSQELQINNLKNWPTGKYITEIITADKYGQEVKSISYFTLYESQGKDMPVNRENLFHLLDKKAEPGEKARVLIGSSSDSVKVLYELEQDGVLIDKKWISLNNEMKLLRIPIKEEYRGNVHLNLVYIKNGRLYNHNETIRIPYSNKKLDISFETFRDKLQPGEKEEWKLKLTGPKGEKVAAEMVATLYDASLDEFMKNDFTLSPERYFSPSLKWTTDRGYSTSTGQLVTYFWNPNYGFTYLSHNQLNWFGYNMNYYPMIVNYNQVKGLEHGSIVVVSSKDANSVQVSGTVKSSTGEALPGVNVLVSGTTVGTVTDIDGNFKLNYSGNEANLVFSFIGFLTETITVKGKTQLAVELMEDIQKLEEVVVVGYGTTKTSHLNAAMANSASGIEFVAHAEEDELAEAEVLYSMSASADAIFGSRSSSDAIVSFKAGDGVQQTLSSVQARKNFNETAFFHPHLQTNARGEIIINFTVPESLTRWKMLGYAHTLDFKHGRTQNQLVTSKSLMVVPNMPRFFREKDTITLSSKIINLTDSAISGFAQLMLFDATTMEPIDDALQNIQAIKSFEIDSASSTLASWTISIPADLDAVTYRFVASSGKFTDGEEMSIPVLPNRILVTETMPVWVKGNETCEFTLDKLHNNSSSTLTNHSLSFEFTANPAWYAIQALPYMMSYPYDCMEQTFSKFYANSIASHIVNSNPNIRKVFETWQNDEDSESFLSKLEKNQELKQLMLEETPWVLDARNESERKKRVALLFDLRRMSNEQERALDKLIKGQNSSGAWPWFKGGPENQYITQHIVTGLGHLSKLGIKSVREDKRIWRMITRAVRYLDNQAIIDLNGLKKRYTEEELKQNYLYPSQVHYLYCRSFFKDIPLTGESQEVIKFYKSQAERYWLNENYYSQALIALAFHRDGETKVPERILKSLRQRSTLSEEMGMYWDQKWGYYWYQMPVETQSIMIEAFSEIANDTASVDQMKLWLLKNKQTTDWKTTKATAEACYALLLQGTSWLSQEIDVEIRVGDITIDPSKIPEVKVEAGTGYFKKTWKKNEISPEMAVVKLTKNDPGVSWGGLYWQYFEDLDKITPSETPLKLEKELFVERTTDKGPIIEPIDKSDPIRVGDKIIVRIILRVDRKMEYLHMKDMRATAFEPMNVISQGKYQDGLWYYETTKDASTNFFFDNVRKGTYVFEYPLRATHSGIFSNGITSIQCMYAPEFNSHSEGIQVRIIE